MSDYLQVANDPMLWLMAAPGIGIVALQAVLFSKKAFNAGQYADLSRSEAWKAFKVGAISAIGPALAVFIVMLGMMSVVGAPITWMRLAMIGSAPTELTGATMGAQAMGVEFGGPNYGITEFSASVWTMALNGVGWLLFTGLFAHRLTGIRDRISKGDDRLTVEIGGAAMLGAFAYLVGGHLIAGGGRLIAAVISGLAMIALVYISKRMPKLLEYNLGIAMIIGMIAGVLFT
ncbi:DUF5058 family protein [Gudongella sp. DL1XJH-153]|uniref:DUF5058 family protein n=1 Tax=Gudongella sp. DL1XJH-153 TaxID=3409804 RepID=UPI003BB4A41B